MFPLLADSMSFWHMDIWYALPAIIAVSLVYSATRHEEMRPILFHAGRVGLWIVGFMTVVFGALAGLDWGGLTYN
jgi:cytochrome c oxidase assembly factor CtaG